MSPALARSIHNVPAFRISSGDTNYFALLFDPSDGADQVCVIEIFNPGGATPPNAHRIAHEIFYVLDGEGIAICGEERFALSKGKALLVKPGCTHVIENTGKGKLYTLTVMLPNEAFAELILNGEPVALDAEDLAILSNIAPAEASA